MRTLRTTAPAVLLWLAAAVWCAEPPAKSDAPAPEQLAAWVRQLGDENFQAREEAQQKLLAAGQPAVAPLRTAAQSEDAEVRTRAEKILKLLKELTTAEGVQTALRDLDAEDWEKVRAALELLWDEAAKNRSVQERVEKAACCSAPSAPLAKVLQRRLAANKLFRQRLDEASGRLGGMADPQGILQGELGRLKAEIEALRRESEKHFAREKALAVAECEQCFQQAHGGGPKEKGSPDHENTGAKPGDPSFEDLRKEVQSLRRKLAVTGGQESAEVPEAKTNDPETQAELEKLRKAIEAKRKAKQE